jgi:hypothetical protein
MRQDIKVMLVHLAIGAVLGYASFLLGNPLMAAGIAIIIGVILRYATNSFVKEKKDMGWWLGNGGMVYFFVWFIVWVIALNLARMPL